MSHVEKHLKNALETLLAQSSASATQAGFEALSAAYRSHQPGKVRSLKAEPMFWGYLAGRMMATFAGARRALGELAHLAGSIESVLDVGAGPGTASYAALAELGASKFTLIEREVNFIDLGQQLAQLSGFSALGSAAWVKADLKNSVELPSADLVIAAYAMGEMAVNDALRLASAGFAAARIALVLVEPGTPQGFERIRALRKSLIEQGGHVLAPCAHDLPCPMQGADFCHIATRFDRPKFHRAAKLAALPYEDEKISYLVVTKELHRDYQGRIVKRPIKGGGHVTLDVCAKGEISRQVIARSNKPLYALARRSEWGDRWLS